MSMLPTLVVVLSMVILAVSTKPDIALTPQMGWNSWNHFGCDISESLIKETVDAIVSLGLAKVGYNYINLDDCWQASERNMTDSTIQPDEKRFPNGMKSLSDYIHSKGLKFGIYSSAGYKTCQKYPASLGLEEIDASLYASWGVDYLKYDNCYSSHGSPYARYPPMAKALESTGRDILYSLCEWGRQNPAAWAGKIAHSWRVTGDINDSFHSIVTRAAITAPLWRYAGPGGWNDPDMLEVGNGKCSDDEYRYHFSLWAMMKSPMIIGNDVRNMTIGDATMTILGNTEIIEINQDPLGRQARRIWSDTMSAQRGQRLLAVKCATGISGAYEDSPKDQQWTLQDDGTIQSISTGECLLELTPKSSNSVSNILVDELDYTFGLWGVSTTSSCETATRWKYAQGNGGGIVSDTTGRCLEVSNFELIPLIQGKRVQTGECRKLEEIDVSSHQGWVHPNGQLMNLYQRQCLTVDRDAPTGLKQEIWSTPLVDNSIAVMLANRGPIESIMTLSWDMIGVDSGSVYKVRDLWKHEDIHAAQKNQLNVLVPSHGVVMLKLSPVM